jgi:hypothetical protein
VWRLETSKTTEILGVALWIAIYAAIPCLTLLAYQGWAKQGRHELPLWRCFLGVGSMVMTLLVWLGTAYFGYRLYAHLATDFFPATWMAVNALLAILAAAGSLALKGRPRALAAAAALLMAAPWILDYMLGLLNRA